MKVLVVDDSKIVRDRLVNLLDSIEGVDIVEQAGDGRSAILVNNNLKPNVIILDIRMVETNGIKLLKKFKNNRYDQKIIMLTNFPYPQYRKKCFEEGADYFLDKSTEFDEVARIINSLVKKHRSSTRENPQLGI
ncbi:MAG: response regulator transcription factor [Candidatus Dadabacteria bacterium]|nr:MAG: response regulator transcription factor [Candidatus Dadabacteria bacterium]